MFTYNFINTSNSSFVINNTNANILNVNCLQKVIINIYFLCCSMKFRVLLYTKVLTLFPHMISRCAILSLSIKDFWPLGTSSYNSWTSCKIIDREEKIEIDRLKVRNQRCTNLNIGNNIIGAIIQLQWYRYTVEVIIRLFLAIIFNIPGNAMVKFLVSHLPLKKKNVWLLNIDLILSIVQNVQTV